MELKDLMELKALEGGNSMSPYEQVKISHMQSKRPSNVSIASVTIASGSLLVGVGAWLFAGLYGSAKAKEAKETANSAKELTVAYVSGIDKRLDNIGALLESEVTRRIQGDQTITQTITDTVSGSQQGQLSASQIATNEATAQVIAGVMTGKYAETPQKVELLTPARPFQCGCNQCGD